MRAVQPWRLAAALFWTILSISLFVEFTSAAPGSGQDANSENSQNNLNRRGMRALREMRNLRRSHRSKFPLKPADPQRKSKRNSGKKIKTSDTKFNSHRQTLIQITRNNTKKFTIFSNYILRPSIMQSIISL